jgi:oligopeptide transport system substrate-binding protein
VPENHLIRALFEGLAVKNPYTLEPEPGVAESWEFSEDRRRITFHINPEARWSNGDP